MSSAQYRYDRQSPEDSHPEEPDDIKVEQWANNEGAEVLIDRWKEYQSIGCRLDFVQWQEQNWDMVVEIYSEEFDG